MSRALVIGYGSIGQRHARVLEELGHDVAVVSRRTIELERLFTDASEAVASFEPDYVVVANETSAHRDTMSELAKCGFGGTVLVEKPLYAALGQHETPPKYCFVAYNLRFHPLLNRLRDWLGGRAAVSATIYVGQHLSSWRPGRDFRKSYSASPELGGGVLRDLSHELDYALWLFGAWENVTALGGASGALGIEADDSWSILARCEQCQQVSITLSYLDRAPRRVIVVNTEDDTACVDFISGTISIGDGSEPKVFVTERDETYRAQHTALLSGMPGQACTFEEGLDVVAFIEAIETAARSRAWTEKR